MKLNTIEALKTRRTHYELKNTSPLTQEEIVRLVKDAVLYTPSAFNSQTARVVILLKEEHKKLWEITKDSLKKIVPEASFSETEEKINSFKNGYGTILFFEQELI